MPSRRHLLGLIAAGVAGLAGCGRITHTARTYEGTLTLNEEASARFVHRASEPIRLSYSLRVRRGAPVDVFLIDPEDAPSVETDGVAYVERGTRLNVREADVTADLPAGEWILVIENGDRGAAIPPNAYVNDRVDVEFAYAFE